MKKTFLFTALIFVFPLLDGCDFCNCVCPDGSCDFTEVNIQVHRIYANEDYLNFYIYMDQAEAFHRSSFGSSLMACECDCTGPELVSDIREVTVTSYPSFFDDEASSNVTSLMKPNIYSEFSIIDQVPKFHYCGGGINFSLLEKSVRADTTYIFEVIITKEDNSTVTVKSPAISLL